MSDIHSSHYLVTDDYLATSETSSEDQLTCQPTGERWDPLGAPNEDDEEPSGSRLLDDYCDNSKTLERLRALEEEQEELNSSLLALTTHFAQVQFRLHQIVEAPSEDKEDLLKSLEEFAFRGIPDVPARERIDEANLAETVRLRRTQQRELIEKLKLQLRELEQYAFETGDSNVPQDIVLERQRFILNELKMRMNLQLDEQKYYKLTPAEVKQQVDVALNQLVNPLRMKEHLVAQLKTQVADLERFINYMQVASKHKRCVCGCALHSIKKQNKQETIGIIHKTAMLLQMFAMLHLGCGPRRFKRNDLKSTAKANHWGDLRARLELAIAKVKETIEASSNKGKANCGEYTSDPESTSVSCNVRVTTAVRKYLATSIRDLMEHGAVFSEESSLVPFIGCFPRRITALPNTEIHAWEIILKYYELKNGDRFNSTPARKLSQSFNLELSGASLSTSKHNMLCAIGSIISTHTPYKRSYDSHFKAFVCAALNAGKLVPWLSLIFQCRQLINMHYLPWSYVAKTGFQDSLHSLDTLTAYKFDLPVDLAVHQFQNIKDVFT